MKKEILKDALGKLITVKIAYQDWLDIEALLPEEIILESATEVDIMRFHGCIKGGEDPLLFQKRMRDE